jgi:hypothetical protein
MFTSQFIALAAQQEDGAQPGASITTMHAILLYVGYPIALFVGISAVVLLATTQRKKNNGSLTHID